jgi:hypothetical protein
VGRALRSVPDEEGGHLVSLAFTWLSLRAQKRIRALLAERDPLNTPSELDALDALGGAGGLFSADAGDGAEGLQAPAQGDVLSRFTNPEIELDPAMELEPEPEEEEASERRRDARHSYGKRVIARGSERPRVLLGRDLSLGGMRVDPDPDLPLGTELQVALHARAGVTPLVLVARVVRDDGEGGLFLGFQDVTDGQREYLSGMLGLLPTLDESGQSVVVSEVLSGDHAA